MAIFIDGDGCPVTEITVLTAKKYKIPVTIVCDTCHVIEKEGAKTVTVDKGNDFADYYIANLVGEGDIVVTGDYPLASMVLAKKGVPISHNGMIFSENNIDSLLLRRHIAKKIRRSGKRLKGPSKRTKEDDENFLKALEMIIKKSGY
ncbi:MAG: YaiI/YqxD family protein [Clostridia bacterium]|nr:YaiI/YqxD family protein [Clostridia bacterium]